MTPRSLKLQRSCGSWKRGWKGEPGLKSCLPTLPHSSVTGRRRFRFGIPLRESASVPTASPEGSATFQIKCQGMIYAIQRACICPRLWLDNVTEQAHCPHKAWPAPSSPFPLLPLCYFLGWVSNKSANWWCLLCKQTKGWTNRRGRADTSKQKLMRKEKGARLDPLGRSKPPVWLRPYHSPLKSVSHIVVNILTHGFCLSHFHLQFRLLTLWS